MSKSQCASSTSRPLFIRVAESMVIFGPIRQVGWARACLTVTARNCSSEARRKGPPEAVSSKRFTSVVRSPRRHCQMALCSLSTGTMDTPARCASRITRWPAITSVSLFARDDPGQRSSRRLFYLGCTRKTGHQRWLKFLRLLRQQCDIAAGGQRHYTKMLREAPYYIQRLPADRAGAAEQSYAPWEIGHMFLCNLNSCIVLRSDYSMGA